MDTCTGADWHDAERRLVRPFADAGIRSQASAPYVPFPMGRGESRVATRLGAKTHIKLHSSRRDWLLRINPSKAIILC